MTGPALFVLTVLSILATTNGLHCPIPCTDEKVTSCPPGYRCDIGSGECVKSDCPDTCFQVGLARLYNGKVSETVAGVKCQRWDSNIPHKPYHRYVHDDKFPEGSVSEASNYCRDPSNTGRPWCYTVDPDDRWDYCEIPPCSSRNCFRRGFAFLYEGNTDVTKENVLCQRWDSSAPHKHSFSNPDKYPDKSLKEARNFCRSPSKSATPWCYTTSAERWQYCDIEHCPYNYCYDSGEAWRYIGTTAKTMGGLQCQNWNSQSPHEHSYGDNQMNFPEGDVDEAKNYCRDPSKTGRPWCYTTDPGKRWDWCCVEQCSDIE